MFPFGNPFQWIGDTIRMIILINAGCLIFLIVADMIFLLLMSRMIMEGMKSTNFSNSLVALFKLLVVIGFIVAFIVCVFIAPPVSWLGDLVDVVMALLAWRWVDGQRPDTEPFERVLKRRRREV